jgi:hypothetical protein
MLEGDIESSPKYIGKYVSHKKHFVKENTQRTDGRYAEHD